MEQERATSQPITQEEAALRLSKDHWALPPRGVTVSVCKKRDGDDTLYTYLCEQDDCFAMAYSMKSEEHARGQVSGHACPAPPRRGLVPTGKSLLESMWDELDDALEAFKAWDTSKGELCFRDMNPGETKGYIKGIAEVITFSAVPYFRVAEDVLRQANKRWKMNHGLEPFSPTPSYRWNPIIDEYRNKARAKERSFATPNAPAKKTAARRAPVKKAPEPVKSGPRTFTPQEVATIKDMLHNRNIPAGDLAKMYGVSEQYIRNTAGPKPGAESNTSQGIVITPLWG